MPLIWASVSQSFGDGDKIWIVHNAQEYIANQTP